MRAIAPAQTKTNRRTPKSASKPVLKTFAARKPAARIPKPPVPTMPPILSDDIFTPPSLLNARIGTKKQALTTFRMEMVQKTSP